MLPSGHPPPLPRVRGVSTIKQLRLALNSYAVESSLVGPHKLASTTLTSAQYECAETHCAPSISKQLATVRRWRCPLNIVEREGLDTTDSAHDAGSIEDAAVEYYTCARRAMECTSVLHTLVDKWHTSGQESLFSAANGLETTTVCERRVAFYRHVMQGQCKKVTRRQSKTIVKMATERRKVLRRLQKHVLKTEERVVKLVAARQARVQESSTTASTLGDMLRCISSSGDAKLVDVFVDKLTPPSAAALLQSSLVTAGPLHVMLVRRRPFLHIFNATNDRGHRGSAESIVVCNKRLDVCVGLVAVASRDGAADAGTQSLACVPTTWHRDVRKGRTKGWYALETGPPCETGVLLTAVDAARHFVAPPTVHISLVDVDSLLPVKPCSHGGLQPTGDSHGVPFHLSRPFAVPTSPTPAVATEYFDDDGYDHPTDSTMHAISGACCTATVASFWARNVDGGGLCGRFRIRAELKGQCPHYPNEPVHLVALSDPTLFVSRKRARRPADLSTL